MAQVKFDASQVTIRPMTAIDVVAAVDCFADHYDVFDAPVTVGAFLAAFPEAFFVATLHITTTDDHNDYRHTEQVIGVCAAPIVVQNRAFVGLYGLRYGYRGSGVGTRLFERVLDYVGPERSVGLFAVPEMRAKYIARGVFTNPEGVCMVNYVGAPSERHFAAFTELCADRSVTVRFFTEEDTALFDAIVEYDAKIHSEARRPLLSEALPSKAYITCVVVDGGCVKGYGCVREHSRSGRLMLGPLYADTREVAERLVANLLGRVPHDRVQNSGVVLNAVDAQPQSLALATDFVGLDEIERCERLWRGTAIEANYALIYGVFSLDFSL